MAGRSYRRVGVLGRTLAADAVARGIRPPLWEAAP